LPINPDAAGTTSPRSLPARIGWAALIVATLYVCYFSHLGAIGFVGPDEPRYAWVARAMVESGDWVTPRLYGKPWFEKPVLYYWEAALSFKVLGVSETAARLPSAVSALLATLALAWLAWRLYGAETARWLLLLLPTTVGMIGFSHAAAMDMPFTGMLTVAMVCAAVALRLIPERKNAMSNGEPAAATGSQGKIIPPANRRAGVFSTPWLALILFGFFLGLAVLAKGPAGIILCGGAVFFWGLFTKLWRDAFRLLHPLAVASFCLTALPWYILCARRNPDFFRVFIIEHNFKRFLTPEFQHIQPFWFYGPVLLIAFLPWTVTVVWSIFVGIARIIQEQGISSRTGYFVCWPLFCFLFFSVSKSKLPGYLLPAVPAIGLLAAHAQTTLAHRRHRSYRLVLLLTSLSFAIVLSLIAMGTPKVSRGTEQFGVAVALLLFLLGLANLILGLAYTPTESGFRRVLAACCVLPILFALFQTDSFIADLFPWDPSGRAIAHELRLRDIPTDLLMVAGMSRGLHYSLNFYLHQEIKGWDSATPTQGFLLTGSRLCKGLVGPNYSCQQLPFNLESTGRFLYRVKPTPSVERSASGGKLQ
jgi:4-amino-4-deoxy-L-arabinose transferase-like glycosyltransferase